MGVGIIFSQWLGGASAGPQALAPLAPAPGAIERLISLDPPGHPATLLNLLDVEAVPLEPGTQGLARYRASLVSDTGPAAEPYGALMLVAFAVPTERKAEVDDWYLNEHIALLMRADGWLRARRYEVMDMAGEGVRWTSLAFHELRDLSVMQSEERRTARSTAWRAKLEPEDWFKSAGRWVFAPVR